MTTTPLIGTTLHLTERDANALVAVLGRVVDNTHDSVLEELYTVLTDAGFSANLATKTYNSDTGEYSEEDEDDVYRWVAGD